MMLRLEAFVLKKLTRRIATRGQNILCRAGLEKDPAKVLFVDDDRSVSYGDFQKWIGKCVATLFKKYAINKGDRVLCRTTKSLDAVALYMACLQIGAIYVPVNPSYTLHETKHFVEDCSPKLMVTCTEEKDSALHELISNIVNENKFYAESKSATTELDVENVENDHVACICYTSGTTGLPKGVMLTHGSLSTNAEALVHTWRFTRDDKLLHMLPFYHVHGMFISLNCSLFSHSTVIWRERFSIEDCLRWLPSTTVMMGVPTYYSRLLSSPGFNRQLLSQLRLFTCGSAPLSTPLWVDFKSRTGHSILERYGMTEAQVICSNPYDDRRPGSVGKPIADTKLRINQEGVIEIKSSSLFAGYWNNPEKTANDFTMDKYFITGDLGSVDEDAYFEENSSFSCFLHILGRKKDLIITGGFNVYPKEVEDCIDHLPDVEESAIIGVPHKDLGEVVVAVVNSKSLANEKGSEQAIISALKKVLVEYKIPRRVIFVPSLPRNSMAKIQKNVLREQLRDLFDEK
ncbi:AMP-binding enzyme [Parelaphostrongylus tenuis]|uniref:AMP-binding enzyme n=1 Tax=Parelaphostrongylus tenuis TaxID=148309 RepID=A0AAD5QFT3_PARTN|nr:AMP-binding enzyme [Parelaphostrongylus tenuis]